MMCYLFEAPTYLFYTSDLPELLFYSHIPTGIIAILAGLFVFLNNRKALLNKLLFLISICFTLWTLASLTAWTNINASFIAFIWPVFGILTAFLSLLCIYFVYVFLAGKDIHLRIKLIFIALLAPVLLFAHTDLSISGFNLVNCDAFGFEGLAYKLYYTLLGYLAIVWIAVLLFIHYRRATAEFKNKLSLSVLGLKHFSFYLQP